MCFFLMSQWSITSKIRFLGLVLCSQRTHTHTKVNTEALSWFQECLMIDELMMTHTLYPQTYFHPLLDDDGDGCGGCGNSSGGFEPHD